MRYILDKICRENRSKHLRFNNCFFENRAVLEITSKNMMESQGPQMTLQYGAYDLHAG